MRKRSSDQAVVAKSMLAMLGLTSVVAFQNCSAISGFEELPLEPAVERRLAPSKLGDRLASANQARSHLQNPSEAQPRSLPVQSPAPSSQKR